MEKFYCVGCKQHYELKVHTPQRQASKGGSYRHSLISECPKGHRVNKLCKKEVYETYSETFESPYAGSKALSGISLTTDELTETIGSGTFDEASLNSSGHQNIFANAESVKDLKSKAPATVYGKPVYGVLVNDDGIIKYIDDSFHKGADGSRDESIQASVDFLNRPGAKYEGTNVKFIRFDDGVTFSDMQFSWASEEGNTPVQDPMEFGEMANWTPLDGTPSLKKRKRAEGMTVGVNLEALAPTPDEPETGESLVPADSLLPEGSGHVIGSQSTSHNFTPFHAEVAYAVSWEGKEDNNEGLIYGIEYTDEVGDVADVEWFSTAEERDEELARYLEQYGAEDHSLNAETFIAYPELKDHLVSIMPDKVYGITSLDDGDFEMKVANRYMDEVIEAVSNYQQTQSDSDLMFGQSKTKIALAAAGVAVLGAWIWNNRK